MFFCRHNLLYTLINVCVLFLLVVEVKLIVVEIIVIICLHTIFKISFPIGKIGSKHLAVIVTMYKFLTLHRSKTVLLAIKSSPKHILQFLDTLTRRSR